MLQKSQWMLAATALAVGIGITAARPAQAQVRIHLKPGMVLKTTPGTGIVLPSGLGSSSSSTASSTKPSSTTSSSSSTKPSSSSSSSSSTKPNSTGSSSAKPATGTTTPTHTVTVSSTPPPVVHSASQGFSVGPGLLGEPIVKLGYLVNRVGPDVTGEGHPTVHKVVAHH